MHIGTVALKLAIAQIRKPADPYFQKPGASVERRGTSAGGVLEEVATVVALKEAFEDPNSFFKDILATSGTLRKPAEPYLQKQGRQWSDVAPVLEEVATVVALKEAFEDPNSFFKDILATSGTVALKLPSPSFASLQSLTPINKVFNGATWHQCWRRLRQLSLSRRHLKIQTAFSKIFLPLLAPWL
ncbi:unnamed protein product [Polarella glacialis]|uniref:Uncharacterized protein n=1 Tax=Polarella glacialis TaxID=89957 RepID=A0A813DE33_POLGL|nr:unnamed protein product [Polarella glacialis]